ncbi:hypothetical protein C2W62_52030, partial [Candidatus Entotheonella serta]
MAPRPKIYPGCTGVHHLEGTLEVANGPARGVQSIEIGVRETGSTQAGQSLQLSGSGRQYADFSWQSNQPQTFGRINAQQNIGSEGTPPINQPIEANCPAQIDAMAGMATQKVSKKGGVGGPVALASGYENTYPLPNRPE